MRLANISLRPVRCFRLETDPDTGLDVRVEIPKSATGPPEITSFQMRTAPHTSLGSQSSLPPPTAPAASHSEQALLSRALVSAPNKHSGAPASGGAPSDAAAGPVTYTHADEQLSGLFSDGGNAVDLSDEDEEASANAVAAVTPLNLRHADVNDRR